MRERADSRSRMRVIRPGGAEYPRLLEEIPVPPKQLHVAGQPLEPAPYVAIVGTRRPSRYGLEVASWLARELTAAGVVVVSGMAAGIDAAAHRGALGAGGPTVAVLGNGIDVCYPKRHGSLQAEIRARGSLVSEYPPGTPPLPYHFPVRNRIIAGMCLGVVILEARLKGGAMITARLAAELGREVFAIPGPVHSSGSEGSHLLIREGARLATSASDILEDLGLQGTGSSNPVSPEGETPPLAPDERSLLLALEAEPVLLDRLAKAAGMPPSAAASVLARLELQGLVIRHPGGRFARSLASAGRPAPGARTAGPPRCSEGRPPDAYLSSHRRRSHSAK
jgi:DNA processing protein